VQIPFLQYFDPKIKIVPMVLSYAPGDIYKEISRGLASAIAASKRKVVIVASSDMTHYEPVESANRKDNLAIGAVLKLDADLLLQRVSDEDITMCGYAPAVVLITAAKELGASGAELVRYQTSGDTTGDYASVVGYAGIILKAAGG
jgi:AmmeMemoRadiSam system protein B